MDTEVTVLTAAPAMTTAIIEPENFLRIAVRKRDPI
jgi:hypothetical protein